MIDNTYLPKNQTVLVSGGGIAGASLAYWLHRYGFTVTVVEKAAGVRKGGYRVDIRGSAVKVAECMGIMPQVRQQAFGVHNATLVDRNGKKLVEYSDADFPGGHAPDDAEIMRGDLCNILHDQTKENVEYLFNDRITSIVETDDNVFVAFASGQHRFFDLVIGADGLHSDVRKLVFGNERNYIKNSGYYFATFNIPNSLRPGHQEWKGFLKGSVFNIFSSDSNGEATALIIFDSPAPHLTRLSVREQKRLLAEYFKDAGGIMKEMLTYLPASKNFYFDSVSQVHMDRLSTGRIALLGDAGYCPSFASGQGVSVAMVGAYVLAGELAAADKDHRTGFRNYESRMKKYIHLNLDLGSDRWKHLLPASAMEAWMRGSANWLIFHLPFGKRIIKERFHGSRQKLDTAANGIELRDYTASEEWAEWIRVFQELIVDKV